MHVSSITLNFMKHRGTAFLCVGCLSLCRTSVVMMVVPAIRVAVFHIHVVPNSFMQMNVFSS